jgi:hypothetical protein
VCAREHVVWLRTYSERKSWFGCEHIVNKKVDACVSCEFEICLVQRYELKDVHVVVCAEVISALWAFFISLWDRHPIDFHHHHQSIDIVICVLFLFVFLLHFPHHSVFIISCHHS